MSLKLEFSASNLMLKKIDHFLIPSKIASGANSFRINFVYAPRCVRFKPILVDLLHVYMRRCILIPQNQFVGGYIILRLSAIG